MRDDFAVMICSHGRAQTMTTYSMLRKQGYTGKIIVVIDEEDDQRELYEANFDCVEVFRKDDYAGTFDEVVLNHRGSVAFARNACFDIAKKHNLAYFCEMDDDLTGLVHRYIYDGKAKGITVCDLDSVFDMVDMFFENPKIFCVSFVKGSDFIGGIKGKGFKKGFEYTAHCVFILKTDRYFKFNSTIYEDLSTGLSFNKVGKIFISYALIEFFSHEVGKNNLEGGATDLYEKFSAFSRAFSVLMSRPDAVKIAQAKDVGHRVQINWDRVAPKIIPERWRK